MFCVGTLGCQETCVNCVSTFWLIFLNLFSKVPGYNCLIQWNHVLYTVSGGLGNTSAKYFFALTIECQCLACILSTERSLGSYVTRNTGPWAGLTTFTFFLLFALHPQAIVLGILFVKGITPFLPALCLFDLDLSNFYYSWMPRSGG